MRVVYVCTSPSPRAHAGGVKVIYDHCSALNEMGVDAAILHERRGYVYPWTEHTVPTIACADLRPTDHLVLPEIKAAARARMLVEAGVRYSIFVQNGYYLSECGRRLCDADTHFAYSNATAILSISSDTTKLIELHYPELAGRIVNMRCSIDTRLFATANDKRNLITYMPRKNGRHAAAVAFALKRRLPAGWDLQTIDGMSEREVASALQRSRIFMSFSDLEGLGLPPIEAALCGNYVIGYHGGGGREYWHTPNFHAVEAGDIGGFVQRVVERVEKIDRIEPDAIAALQPGIDALRARYSLESERASLRQLADALIAAADVEPGARPATRLASLARLQRRPKLRLWVKGAPRWVFARARRRVTGLLAGG